MLQNGCWQTPEKAYFNNKSLISSHAHRTPGDGISTRRALFQHTTSHLFISFWLLSTLCPLVLQTISLLSMISLCKTGSHKKQHLKKAGQWITLIPVIKTQSFPWAFCIHLTSELAGAGREGHLG